MNRGRIMEAEQGRDGGRERERRKEGRGGNIAIE